MGYPPGAEHARHAPYNQFSSGNIVDTIHDIVTDEDCNEVECTVDVVYAKTGSHVQVISYEVKTRKQHDIPEDILDEQVRDIIREQFNEHTQIEFV